MTRPNSYCFFENKFSSSSSNRRSSRILVCLAVQRTSFRLVQLCKPALIFPLRNPIKTLGHLNEVGAVQKTSKGCRKWLSLTATLWAGMIHNRVRGKKPVSGAVNGGLLHNPDRLSIGAARFHLAIQVSLPRNVRFRTNTNLTCLQTSLSVAIMSFAAGLGPSGWPSFSFAVPGVVDHFVHRQRGLRCAALQCSLAAPEPPNNNSSKQQIKTTKEAYFGDRN